MLREAGEIFDSARSAIRPRAEARFHNAAPRSARGLRRDPGSVAAEAATTNPHTRHNRAMHPWRERLARWFTPMARRMPLSPNAITIIALFPNDSGGI